VTRRLYRNENDAMLGGVCSGLGDYLAIDPTWVRLFFILLTLATGFGLLMYLVMWIMMPKVSKVADSGVTQTSEGLAQANIIVGATLLALGLMFLVKNLNLTWFGLVNPGLFWPLLLIGIGGFALWRILNERPHES